LQAGGRRFDPVWLHQPSLLRSYGWASQTSNFVFVREKSIRVRCRPSAADACVLSDIVKRRSYPSVRAREIARGSAAMSVELDRTIVGTILKQAGLSESGPIRSQ
jgi:hypothetical protein